MDRPLSEQNVNARRYQFIGRVALVIAVIALALYTVHAALSPTVDLKTIRIAKVNKGSIKASINAGGLVVPHNEETISSEFDTQVLKVLAKPGQQVNQGDALLMLDTQAINLVIDNLREKRALKDNQIQTEKLTLEKSQNDLRSRIELLEVDLESRQSRVDRYSRLNRIGASSAQQLLEAELDVKRTQIELKQLKQSIIDNHSTSETMIKGLQLEKSILSKELQEQQRLANLSTIVAPREGVVTWVQSDEGASVAARQPLVKLADLSSFRIEATLSDFYATQLKPGMTAEILYRDQLLTGRLETLVPTIENGLMKLMLELDQPNHPILRSNLRVDVGLITETLDDVLTIDKGPFVNGRGVHDVFVIRHQTAFKSKVTIGASDNDRYQVVEGLEPGDQVIISDVSNFKHLNEFKIN